MYEVYALVFVLSIICLLIAIPGLKSKYSKTYPRYNYTPSKDPEPKEDADEETEPEIKEQEKKPPPLWGNRPLTEQETKERDRRFRVWEEEKRPEREKQRNKDKPVWLKFKKVYSAVPHFLEKLDNRFNISRSCDCIAHAVRCVKCGKKTDWRLKQIKFIFTEQYEKYLRATRPELFESESKSGKTIVKALGLRIKIITQPRKKNRKKKRKRVTNTLEQNRTEQKKEKIPFVDLDEVRKKIEQQGGL